MFCAILAIDMARLTEKKNEHTCQDAYLLNAAAGESSFQNTKNAQATLATRALFNPPCITESNVHCTHANNQYQRGAAKHTLRTPRKFGRLYHS